MIDRSDDVLSAILATIRLRARIYHHASFCGDWALDSPQERRASFHIVGSGRCRLELAATGQSVSLAAGDLALLPRNTPHRLSGDAGAAFTTLLCGYFEFSLGGSNPILDTLPDLIVLPGECDSSSGAQLASLSTLMLSEADRLQTGSRIALDRLAEVLLVFMLRRYLEGAADARACSRAWPINALL
ncbi:cupin domain-containing protein, partial [Methylogaea oryzae]|uniref:cupin domain-containing protein n=1 Tax=Methylogaea oryzae TaxID=1295382 RepID=UPI00138F43F0